ncbi:MAG TPA: hypothetical protein VMU39_19375 [Solirubrobacteraceae bacterium]|nr:hypothetical protein [Solirubrobacteraceae bacterium]
MYSPAASLMLALPIVVARLPRCAANVSPIEQPTLFAFRQKTGA